MTSPDNESKNSFISVEDLYQLKQISELTFRPDTNEVYYSVNQANKEDNGYRNAIWKIADKPQQFTQGLPRDGSIKWSPDGTLLAFISARGVLTGKASAESKPPKPQIFLIPFDGGEAIQLTKLPNGVSNFEWSADGKKIVFISRLNKEELDAPSEEEQKEMLSDEIALMKMEKKILEEKKIEPRVITRTEYRAGISYKDDRKGQIHVIDLETKKVKRWTNNLEDDYSFAYLLPDNSSAVTARQKLGEGDETRNWELVKISPKGKVTVIVKDHYGWGFYFELSSDGTKAVSTISDENLGTLGQEKLCVYDLTNGKRTILAEEIDNHKNMAIWSEDDQYIYFTVPEKGQAAIWRVNVSTDETEKIVGGNRIIAGFDISTDDEWLTYHALHVNDPSKLYRYHIPTKKEELLDAPNQKFLKKKNLGKTEEVWYYGNNADYKIQGWILTPPEFDENKSYPLALNMHGGPHVMWSNHQTIPMFHEFQLLAAAGYVVFYCNPRGSDGYGQEFYKAIEKAWGDDDSQDILNGVDLVVKKGIIDEKRMGITGGSYAGFMTAWIIGHDNRFAAAVSQRGVYFLSSFWATTDNARVLIDDEFGVSPLEDNPFLWERSPAAYAENITTPLRIIHSDQDYRAPIPDAEMLFQGIKRSHPDLDVELIRYPGEGHELSRSGKPTRRLDRLDKIIEWFDKYCQPEKYKSKEEQKKATEKLKKEAFEQLNEKIKKLKKEK
ncbi:MAG: S9 family peptidase [Candidatus Heimdallarchaeota archaeon]